MDYANIERPTHASLLRATDPNGIKTVEELHVRIYQCLYWMLRNQYPMKLSSLNRMFNVAAHKLGTTVRSSVATLEEHGLVKSFVRGAGLVIIDTDMLKEQEKAFTKHGESLEVLNRMISSAK